MDELNLAEFPLAVISDRFLDGTKTVVLEDTVFDREQNKYLPRRLTLSGSDLSLIHISEPTRPY